MRPAPGTRNTVTENQAARLQPRVVFGSRRGIYNKHLWVKNECWEVWDSLYPTLLVFCSSPFGTGTKTTEHKTEENVKTGHGVSLWGLLLPLLPAPQITLAPYPLLVKEGSNKVMGQLLRCRLEIILQNMHCMHQGDQEGDICGAREHSLCFADHPANTAV